MSLMKPQRKSTETDTSSLDSLDSQRRHHIVEINDCIAIDGINRVTQGEILIDGERVENPRPELAMVFQEPSLLPWRTVLSNVEFPLEAPGSSPGEGGVDVTSHG
jgi:ABC-type taurine transport system ATPase subunit